MLCPACDREREKPLPDVVADNKDKPGAAVEPATLPEKDDEKPATASRSSYMDPSFELRASPAGPYNTGKLGRFVVTIRPRGEYHINQKYPTSVSITAPPSLSLFKTILKKEHAVAFGEQLVRFEVPFTPAQSGSHQVQSLVAFAVCTAKVCIPHKKPLALTLSVQ